MISLGTGTQCKADGICSQYHSPQVGSHEKGSAFITLTTTTDTYRLGHAPGG